MKVQMLTPNEMSKEKPDFETLLKRICYHFAGAVAVGYDFNAGQTFDFQWRKWKESGHIHHWGYHPDVSKEYVTLNELVESLRDEKQEKTQEHLDQFLSKYQQLIEAAFLAGRSQTSWEQFKKDNQI